MSRRPKGVSVSLNLAELQLIREALTRLGFNHRHDLQKRMSNAVQRIVKRDYPHAPKYVHTSGSASPRLDRHS